MSESGGLVAVYLSVAVRTSAGPGPGAMRLPPAEAAALVARKHAVYGDRPPRGFGSAAGAGAASNQGRNP